MHSVDPCFRFCETPHGILILIWPKVIFSEGLQQCRNIFRLYITKQEWYESFQTSSVKLNIVQNQLINVSRVQSVPGLGITSRMHSDVDKIAWSYTHQHKVSLKQILNILHVMYNLYINGRGLQDSRGFAVVPIQKKYIPQNSNALLI